MKQTDLALIAIDFRTLFVPGSAGRILRENDPDQSAGPLFWLAGSAEGNIAGVRQDVDDGVAAELLALSRSEPPFICRARFRFISAAMSGFSLATARRRGAISISLMNCRAVCR